MLNPHTWYVTHDGRVVRTGSIETPDRVTVMWKDSQDKFHSAVVFVKDCTDWREL